MRLLRYYFVAQPVSDAPLTVARRASRFTFRKADAVDAVIASAPRPSSVLERRFRNGATCFVAEADGRLAGFIWISEREYMEDEVRCLYRISPEAHATWDFDVYVVPEYRLGRTLARLWSAANLYLGADGVQWSFSRISAFNKAPWILCIPDY